MGDSYYDAQYHVHLRTTLRFSRCQFCRDCREGMPCRGRPAGAREGSPAVVLGALCRTGCLKHPFSLL